MPRIHGRMSLAAALVAGGLIHAEPPAAKPADSDKVMTLTSESGKPRRCQILKTSKHPSGGTAYEVKAEDNGEILTVIENASPEKVAATLPAPTIVDDQPKPVAGDPIMKPKEYNSKAEKQSGAEPAKVVKPAVQYDKSPQPIMNRWFKPAKSSKPAMKPTTVPAPAPAPAMEAVRHPDPVIRLIGALRDETLPSLREYAAIELSTGPGRHRSEVADALIEAATKDASPTVRACCARCLGEMEVHSAACVTALSTLKNDSEEMVRTAAASALTRVKR